MHKKNINILALVSVLSVAIAFLVTYWRDISDKDNANVKYLFPDLIDQVNEISTIRINKDTLTFQINFIEGEWILPKLAHYPISEDKVKKLIIGIAELETLEARTNNPELLHTLGLDVNLGHESGTEIILLDQENTEIASLIVGTDGKAATSQQTRYVRKPESNQSWLVWNNFDVLDVPIKWIDDSIISIPRWRIQNINIKHSNASDVNIYREKYDDQMFQINNIPENFEPLNPYIANQVGSALDRINALSIKKRVNFNDTKNLSSVTIDTFDGLQVSLKTVEEGNDYWAIFDLQYIEGIRKELPTDGPKIVGLPEMPSIEEVKKEVNALTPKLDKWAFAISQNTFELLNYTIKDLIKRKENIER